MKALLVLGHGSRAKEAQNIFNSLVSTIAKKTEFEIVRGCSMEHHEPSLEDVIAELVEQKINDFVIAPMFIYRGIHIKEDIPQMLAEIKAKYPNISYTITDVIGEDERIAEIMVDRIKKIS